jgi:hypothetical protein
MARVVREMAGVGKGMARVGRIKDNSSGGRDGYRVGRGMARVGIWMVGKMMVREGEGWLERVD